MRILKWIALIVGVMLLQFGLVGGAALAIAAAGSSTCGAPTSADGQLLQGQSAKDWLASLTSDTKKSGDAKRQEALAITKTAYEAGMERSDPVSLRAIWTVVATGIQESNLQNLYADPAEDPSDHDSRGYLQQRPSQGWGTIAQVTDPYFATNTFYDRLEKRYSDEEIETLPLKEMALAIQKPSFTAYMRWNWDKTAAELVSMVANPGVEESCNASSEGWQLPLEPDSYCVGDGFGSRPDARKPGGVGWHNGLDASCNSGDPVFAVADGTVKIAWKNGGFGYNVVIDHGDGVESSYGHLVEGSIPPSVVQNAKVVRGQTIGKVGNTGRSFGAHLHFEIHVNGKGVDPEKFMLEKGVPFR